MRLAPEFSASRDTRSRASLIPPRVSGLIGKYDPCLILTAIRMPGKDGYEVLQEAVIASPVTPVIAITAHASIPGAIKFLKGGGTNYLATPFKADQLIDAVKEALEGSVVITTQRPDLSGCDHTALDSIIGTGRLVLKLKQTLFKVARTDVNVLIQGETGTGKELIAKGRPRVVTQVLPYVSARGLCGTSSHPA